MGLAMISRVAGMWDATSPFWVQCEFLPPCTSVQVGARFGVCRNLGQIITLLLSLQEWGVDLKLTFSEPRTGLSLSLSLKLLPRLQGLFVIRPAC